MAVDSATKSNGLKTLWDTIVAPKEAFESLRAAPTWGWAFLIVIVLSTLSSYLITPAIIHGMTADWPNMVARNPQLAAQTPEQQQAGLALVLKFTQFNWIFTPIVGLIGALLGAVILLIFNAIGRGEGSFAKYWAAQWNIGIVTAAGSIVVAIVVLIRGADSFTSASEVQTAVPGLALLVPATAVKLHAFFSAFTIFGIWATGLEIAALAIIGRVSRPVAWFGGSLTIVLGALLVAAFAK
jgi:hypothetical protein